LIGVDFSTTATKVVRLKESKGSLVLAGLDLLPAVDFSEEEISQLQLPRSMTTNYGCLSYTGPAAIVRMINTGIGAGDTELAEEKIRKHLNVSEDYRVSASLVKRGEGRQDSAFLAAAIPDVDAARMLDMFPAGPPAPASLEVAGLSFMTAFLHARGSECEEKTVCLLEGGEVISHFAFITNGAPTLVGKLPFGARQLREKIAADLGLDEDLATSIMNDASVNISSSVANVLGPNIKQLSISKDFIERHQGSRISKLYVSGGMSLMSGWAAELGQVLGMQVETWSPLENIDCSGGSVPEEMLNQATRFSAAIGAAIGGMEAQ
jgi:Tfp pilus assembly PilM family ATPase